MKLAASMVAEWSTNCSLSSMGQTITVWAAGTVTTAPCSPTSGTVRAKSSKCPVTNRESPVKTRQLPGSSLPSKGTSGSSMRVLASASAITSPCSMPHSSK